MSNEPIVLQSEETPHRVTPKPGEGFLLRQFGSSFKPSAVYEQFRTVPLELPVAA